MLSTHPAPLTLPPYASPTSLLHAGVRTAAVMGGRNVTADEHKEAFFTSLRGRPIAEEDGPVASSPSDAHMAEQLMQLGLPPSRFGGA